MAESSAGFLWHSRKDLGNPNSNLIQHSKGTALPDNVFLHIVPGALRKALRTTQSVQEMGISSINIRFSLLLSSSQKQTTFPEMTESFCFPEKKKKKFVFLLYYPTSPRKYWKIYSFKHLLDMSGSMAFLNDTL